MAAGASPVTSSNRRRPAVGELGRLPHPDTRRVASLGGGDAVLRAGLFDLQGPAEQAPLGLALLAEALPAEFGLSGRAPGPGDHSVETSLSALDRRRSLSCSSRRVAAFSDDSASGSVS